LLIDLTVRVIYLDNAASTRPSDEVIDLMSAVMREDYGNPSSAHPLGAAARRRLDTARAQVLAAIGDPDGAHGELIWTSGGTESDALAVIGAARSRGRGAVIVSALEHDAVRRSAELLGAAYPVIVAPATRDAVIDVDALAALVPRDAAVVALMRVQNELGTLQPVAEAARAVRARAPGVHVHCDGVQALGKIELDVTELGVDSIAFAAHKLHGPKGVGALWIRRGVELAPLWGGGGHQGGRRSGTQDAPGAAGMGLAVERAIAMMSACHARWSALAAILRAAAAASGVEHADVPANAVRAPHVLAIGFRGVSAAALRHTLASRGVAVSGGAACAEPGGKPSHVLAAVGLPADWGMVRFSFGHTTTTADVTAAGEVLAEVVRGLAGRVVSGTSMSVEPKADEPGGEPAQEILDTPIEVETAAADVQPGPDPSIAKIAALEAALTKVEGEKKDNWDKFLRSAADLENHRRRSKRDLDDARAESKTRVLKEMLPVVDNLERALQHAEEGAKGTEPAAIIDGVKLVLRQFTSAFERCDVTAVQADGQPFDPNLHEAISQQETDAHPPGTVVTVLQRGYKLGDRLLRPALVVVAKAPSAPEPTPDVAPDAGEPKPDPEPA